MQVYDHDTLQRFIFENHSVRGAIVRLGASYTEACRLHHYPLAVKKSVGEALAGICLLSSTIKYKGQMTMQTQGDGPMSILLVQCDESLHLRGLAVLKPEKSTEGDFKALVGQGHLILHIDQEASNKRYQGVTEIQEASLAETIGYYFQQSEQLPTMLWLFANEREAAGLLIQQMPGEKEEANFWEHIMTLASTITEKEIFSLSNVDVLYRLFHEEAVRLFDDEVVSFRCRCSKQKMINVLEGLGEKEVQDILEAEGSVSMSCDFCNKQYQFDAVDIKQIFANGDKPEQDDASGVKH